MILAIPIFSRLFIFTFTDVIILARANSNIKCHAVMLGTLSPFVLGLMEEVREGYLILPDFKFSDIGILMNLIYSGT